MKNSLPLDHFIVSEQELDFLPYTHYSSITRQMLDRYLKEKINTLNEDNTVLRTDQSHYGRIEGVGFFRHLEWDTKILNVPIVRIEGIWTNKGSERLEIISKVLKKIKKACRDSGLHYLVYRVSAADIEMIFALERAGFQLIDGIFTLSFDIRNSKSINAMTDPHVELATRSDLKSLYHLGLSSFSKSRFHVDPCFEKKAANTLHGEWMRNSGLLTAADAVVVSRDKDEVLSAVTCKINSGLEQYFHKKFGTIVLVATSHSARGTGLGRQTTLKALNWFHSQGIDIVEVGTQISNVPASRLYESCGFKHIYSSLTFRTLI